MSYKNLYGSLYWISAKVVISILENVHENTNDENEAKEISRKILFQIGSSVVEDVLMVAFSCKQTWNKINYLFQVPEVPGLIMDYCDIENLNEMDLGKTQKILLTNDLENFSLIPSLNYLEKFPIVDFDGELFWKGRTLEALLRNSLLDNHGEWLTSSQDAFGILNTMNKRIVKYNPRGMLQELGLDSINLTPSQIGQILTKYPNLKIVKSYKLGEALYDLHRDDWKDGKLLPKYALKNLDIDFSYVGRSSFSSVLPGNALQLVALLCPSATFIRIRIDCNTNHDVLAPLKTLKKITELSIVCVTNGEWSLLDFNDVIPILQCHGKKALRSLELKVMEKVDSHVIIDKCPKLESLMLSGCSYVIPSTCPYYECQINRTHLSNLKILFYVEGEEDENKNYLIPQCFWYSTLSSEVSDSGSCCKLVALFLKSPRIYQETADDLFNTTFNNNNQFEYLKIFSISQYPELKKNHLNAILSNLELKYLRISECDQFKSLLMSDHFERNNLCTLFD